MEASGSVDVLAVVTKAVSLIADAKQPAEDRFSKTCSCQAAASDRPWLEHAIKKQLTSKVPEVTVDVLQSAEQCHLLLLERWTLAPHGSFPEHSPEVFQQLASFARHINHAGVGRVSLVVNASPLESIQWEVPPSEREVVMNAAVLPMPEGPAWRVSVEYLKFYVKPRPLRPRLMSFETESSEHSLEHSFVNSHRISVLDSPGLFEEARVGFSVLSPAFAAEESSESEEDCEAVLSPADQTEEEAVASYRQLLQSLRRLSLFRGTETADGALHSALLEWNSLSN